jgi:hypothetical protein
MTRFGTMAFLEAAAQASCSGLPNPTVTYQSQLSAHSHNNISKTPFPGLYSLYLSLFGAYVPKDG